MIPSSRIAFFGNFFRCNRIKLLTRSIFFRKSWINSFSKSDPSPDFYNKKHRIMMEVMRVDDYLNAKNEKHPHNSFRKEHMLAEQYLGEDYKIERDDISAYLVTDTSDSKRFNFDGYLQNFEKTVLHHSKRVDAYRRNHPECKDLIFLIFDQSNAYTQTTNGINNIHLWYRDKDFLEIIKNSGADYVIWVCFCKSIIVNEKELKLPMICIYDAKRFKDRGITYNHNALCKV